MPRWPYRHTALILGEISALWETAELVTRCIRWKYTRLISPECMPHHQNTTELESTFNGSTRTQTIVKSGLVLDKNSGLELDTFEGLLSEPEV